MSVNNASVKNASKNASDHNHTNSDTSLHIENIINDFMTTYKSQNEDVTDEMTDNMVDHITEHVFEHFGEIINDIITRYNTENQYTNEQTTALITTHINAFINKYVTDSDLNELTTPIINWKPFKKVVVIDREIKRLDKKLVIETNPHPTQKNPNRVTYVINSRLLCDYLGRKGRRVRNVDKSKLLQLKIESIAGMCMVSLDKVNQVLGLDIKPSPEYLEKQKQEQKRLLKQQKEKEERNREEERKRKERYKANKKELDKLNYDLKYGPPEVSKQILQRVML